MDLRLLVYSEIDHISGPKAEFFNLLFSFILMVTVSRSNRFIGTNVGLVLWLPLFGHLRRQAFEAFHDIGRERDQFSLRSGVALHGKTCKERRRNEQFMLSHSRYLPPRRAEGSPDALGPMAPPVSERQYVSGMIVDCRSR